MTLENCTFSNKPADRCAIWQYFPGAVERGVFFPVVALRSTTG
jgi:hypothetical protein